MVLYGEHKIYPIFKRSTEVSTIRETFVFLSRALKYKPWLKECYQIPHAMFFRHGLWVAHDV